MRRWVLGALGALLGFAGLGTVSALWPNPLFMRMTPARAWEIALLMLLFGGELLLAYFEPVRLYVAAAGTVLLALVVLFELRRRAAPANSPMPSH